MKSINEKLFGLENVKNCVKIMKSTLKIKYGDVLD